MYENSTDSSGICSFFVAVWLLFCVYFWYIKYMCIIVQLTLLTAIFRVNLG